MMAITPRNWWPWHYCKSRIQTSLHYSTTSHNKHDIFEAFPDVRRRNQLKIVGWRLQKHRGGEFRDKIPSGNARHSRTGVLLDSLSINPLPSIHFQHLAVTHKSSVARRTAEISNGMFGPGADSRAWADCWKSNTSVSSQDWKICFRFPRFVIDNPQMSLLTFHQIYEIITV